MPQSTAFLLLRKELVRVLRSQSARGSADVRAANLPTFGADRPLRAKVPQPCKHGVCLALRVQGQAVEVLVRDLQGQEGWAPLARILAPDLCREWARRGFG